MKPHRPANADIRRHEFARIVPLVFGLKKRRRAKNEMLTQRQRRWMFRVIGPVVVIAFAAIAGSGLGYLAYRVGSILDDKPAARPSQWKGR